MDKREVMILLSRIPSSVYRGFPTSEINEMLIKSAAEKYLAELIMKNEKNKPFLKSISEKSREQRSNSTPQRSNSARLDSS